MHSCSRWRGDTVSPRRQIACKLVQMLMAVDDTSDSRVLVLGAVSPGPEVICHHAKTMLKFPGNVKGFVECDVLGHSSREGYYNMRCFEMMHKEPNGDWGIFCKSKKQVLAGIKAYTKVQAKEATETPPKSVREVVLDEKRVQAKTLKGVVVGYLRLARTHGKILEAAKKLKDGTTFPGWTEKQLVNKIKGCLKIARKAGGVVHTPSMKRRRRKQVIDEKMELWFLDTFLGLDKHGVMVTPEFACFFVYNSFSERSEYMAQFKR